MKDKYNLTYWVYLYLDILCYANFVESYNNFVKAHNYMKKLRYQAMSMIVRPIIVRDIAIPVCEFYKSFKGFAPEEYNRMVENEEYKRFIEFTKDIRNNMKYLPKKKNADKKRIDDILAETCRIVKEDSYDGKQTFDYFSGRYFGKHRLYGSTLITNEHILHEINSKYDNNEIDKYMNSIPENLKVIKNSLEPILKFQKSINLSIPNNTKRNRFTVIRLNRKIDDMVLASGFEKEIIFLLILAIQEISAIDFCLDCIFDEEIIKENTILLFFFTKWIATKLDEIIDMFNAIEKFGDNYNLNAKRFKQKLESEIGSFDDLCDPVRNLRNALHYENASKMTPKVEQNISIDINAIYDILCPGYYSKKDYLSLYNKIRTKLNSVRAFCEKNIGVKLIIRTDTQ